MREEYPLVDYIYAVHDLHVAEKELHRAMEAMRLAEKKHSEANKKKLEQQVRLDERLVKGLGQSLIEDEVR